MNKNEQFETNVNDVTSASELMTILQQSWLHLIRIFDIDFCIKFFERYIIPVAVFIIAFTYNVEARNLSKSAKQNTDKRTKTVQIDTKQEKIRDSVNPESVNLNDNKIQELRAETNGVINYAKYRKQLKKDSKGKISETDPANIKIFIQATKEIYDQQKNTLAIMGIGLEGFEPWTKWRDDGVYTMGSGLTKHGIDRLTPDNPNLLYLMLRSRVMTYSEYMRAQKNYFYHTQNTGFILTRFILLHTKIDETPITLNASLWMSGYNNQGLAILQTQAIAKITGKGGRIYRKITPDILKKNATKVKNAFVSPYISNKYKSLKQTAYTVRNRSYAEYMYATGLLKLSDILDMKFGETNSHLQDVAIKAQLEKTNADIKKLIRSMVETNVKNQSYTIGKFLIDNDDTNYMAALTVFGNDKNKYNQRRFNNKYNKNTNTNDRLAFEKVLDYIIWLNNNLKNNNYSRPTKTDFTSCQKFIRENKANLIEMQKQYINSDELASKNSDIKHTETLLLNLMNDLDNIDNWVSNAEEQRLAKQQNTKTQSKQNENTVPATVTTPILFYNYRNHER